MAGRTGRFGFNTFGGDEGGSISDDGFKYSLADREALDAILAAVERHDHRLVVSSGDGAPGAPSLALGMDGALEGGIEYFYRVAILNADGSQTEAGDEASIVLPDLLDFPEPPVVANIEGSMPAGTLPVGITYYGVTSHRGFEESGFSATVPANVIAGSGSVRLELPDYVDGIDSYSVWRQSPGAPGFTRIATVSDAVFIDDGSVPGDPCAGAPGHTPPDFNTGASNYSVQITLPVGVSAPYGWAIYRTDTSGDYDAQSLVDVVTALNDELDPDSGVVTTWVDDGDPLQPGSPRVVDDISFQPFTFETVDALPEASGYPVSYPLVWDGTLYLRSAAGAWEAVSGGGSSLPPVGGEGDVLTTVGGEWVAQAPSGSSSSGPVIFTSPNGSRFIQSVGDDGAVIMTPTLFPGPPAAPILD